MDFSAVINARHSYRSFSDRAIDKTVLRQIVAQAQQTPSWANAQPWQVVIATGDTLSKIRTTFAHRTQQGQAGSTDMMVAHRTSWDSQSRRNMADWSNDLSQYLYGQNVGTKAYSDSQLTLFNSPALVYLTVPGDVNAWQIFDTGAFAQTLMLSAANVGVQSIPAYELVKYPDELRQLLGLPTDQKILMGVALGYADAGVINGFRTSRVATDQMLTIKA